MELGNQTMILCEREDCPHRWYHVSCAGLDEDKGLPENWTCQYVQNWDRSFSKGAKESDDTW